MNEAAGQRIDKWLWHARFFRTRTLAAKFAAGGKIRQSVGSDVQRVVKASQTVRPGDVLTLPLPRGVRMVRILGLAGLRGPAQAAARLYEDLAAAAGPLATPGKGDGRPTKKDRRQLDRLRRPPL